jgi:hypothetical protein
MHDAQVLHSRTLHYWLPGTGLTGTMQGSYYNKHEQEERLE